MKKLLILSVLLCLINTKISAQEIIKNNLYEVVYSEEYQQPLSIKYTIPCSLEELIKPVEESKRISFHKPSGVSTSDDNDYKDNIYDKSHLAPVKAFKCVEDIRNLYSYLNCALMHETLNSGIWSSLEKFEWNLKKKNAIGPVKVSITLIFDNINNKVDGGATIPSYFMKVIDVYASMPYYAKTSSQLKTFEIENSYPLLDKSYWKVERYVYIFPNDESVKGKNINDFKAEELSGPHKIFIKEK